MSSMNIKIDDSKEQIIVHNYLGDCEWQEITYQVKKPGDWSLKVIRAKVHLEDMSVPKNLSGVAFEEAEFCTATKISGLEQGRFLVFDKCNRNTILAQVTLKNCDCRTFEYIAKEPNQSETIRNKASCENLGFPIQFEYCGFHNLSSNSTDTNVFNNVVFLDKLELYSNSDKEETICFNSCIFGNGLQVKLINFKLLNLRILGSKHLENDDMRYSTIFSFPDTTLNCLTVDSSPLSDICFQLFKRPLHDIHIKDSMIHSLDLHTVSSGDGERRIHNLRIVNSEVDQLRANNRLFTHSIDLSQSTFSLPPEFFGAHIPEGSRFPSEKHFIRRDGDADARRYRALRYAMENHRDRTAEGVFFALEQKSLLKEIPKPWRYFNLGLYYSLLSNSGTNYRRPLGVFFLSIMIFSICYAMILSDTISVSQSVNWSLLEKTSTFSVKQSFLPLSSLKDFDFDKVDNSISDRLITIIALFQGIISIVCITLTGLAIRWRFKRG